MRLEQIMSQPAITCAPGDTLATAARLMWEHDCGALPVVATDGTVAGMLTDRDICMAAYTQGRALHAIPVSSAMAKEVCWSHPDDTVEAAEILMATRQIRRLPIVDGQGRPVGVLSLNDIARAAAGPHGDGGAEGVVARTLAFVGRRREPVETPLREEVAPAAA